MIDDPFRLLLPYFTPSPEQAWENWRELDVKFNTLPQMRFGAVELLTIQSTSLTWVSFNESIPFMTVLPDQQVIVHISTLATRTAGIDDGQYTPEIDVGRTDIVTASAFGRGIASIPAHRHWVMTVPNPGPHKLTAKARSLGASTIDWQNKSVMSIHYLG